MWRRKKRRNLSHQDAQNWDKSGKQKQHFGRKKNGRMIPRRKHEKKKKQRINVTLSAVRKKKTTCEGGKKNGHVTMVRPSRRLVLLWAVVLCKKEKKKKPFVCIKLEIELWQNYMDMQLKNHSCECERELALLPT